MQRADDPLSQLLALAAAEVAVSTGLEARGRWAIRVAASPVLKCNAVRRGTCLVEAAGLRRRIEEGDCFLVAPGLSFLIGTDLDCLPRPAEEVFTGQGTELVARLDAGEGHDFLCLGGRMDLPPAASLLTASLPPLAVIDHGSAAAGRIGWLLDRLDEEARSGAPGSAAMAVPITQMIFIELIRALPGVGAHGWLAALSDQRLGPAIRAIHAAPDRNWRLSELAAESHLSRSQFSARFRAAVGRAPMEYLLFWRMALARRALVRPGATISDIAAQFGYASESAFGAAFRRATGMTPRRAMRG